MNELCKIYLGQSASYGFLGEAVFSLKSSVSDSYAIASSIFKLLPSFVFHLLIKAPSFVRDYLFKLSLKEGQKWSVIRGLYQLSMKGTFKCKKDAHLAITSTLILLFYLQNPTQGLFTMYYPTEEHEIITILNTLSTT
jgi:hypothetical protein